MKDYQKKSDDYRKEDNSSSILLYVICGVVVIATLLWYFKGRNKTVDPETTQEEVVDEQSKEDSEEWYVQVCEVDPAYLEIDEACEEVDVCEDVFVEDFSSSQNPQKSNHSTSITATNMEFLYVGVENPIEIKVKDIPAEKLGFSISGHGSIARKSANNYSVKVGSVGEVSINVFADIDGQRKEITSKTYRTKRVPDPIAKVNNKRGGSIAKSTLLKSPVKAVMEDFDYDVKFSIVEFTVSACIKGFIESADSKSEGYTDEQKKLISKVSSGGKVIISNIKAKGPDGSLRDLGALSFMLN
ncbi:MAG: hypothetical protein J6T96_09190 [Bacteroidales bacterium]|nr:hypothetical protein [Bacteroidales bacterium]